jgi:hypothetical protein
MRLEYNRNYIKPSYLKQLADYSFDHLEEIAKAVV